MSLEKDVTQIKKLVEQDDIFKAASQEQLIKRRENMDKNVDKADVIRRVRKGLGYQFESYPWRSMLEDLDLTPAEVAWAEEYLTYDVKCYDPTFKIDESVVNEQEDIFKPASPGNLSHRKEQIRKEEAAEKARKKKIAAARNFEDFCPHCFADLRDEGVYITGVESLSESAYWDETSKVWEWGDREYGDSDMDEWHCTACSGEVDQGKHFDIEGDL